MFHEFFDFDNVLQGEPPGSVIFGGVGIRLGSEVRDVLKTLDFDPEWFQNRHICVDESRLGLFNSLLQTVGPCNQGILAVSSGGRVSARFFNIEQASRGADEKGYGSDRVLFCIGVPPKDHSTPTVSLIHCYAKNKKAMWEYCKKQGAEPQEVVNKIKNKIESKNGQALGRSRHDIRGGHQGRQAEVSKSRPHRQPQAGLCTCNQVEPGAAKVHSCF